ncbi:MAG: addiction module protein [Pseudolabrys sp.]|nr:addiction module protein [Pseudolabrys sp.]
MNEAILDKLMQLTLAERLDIANKLRDSMGADQSEIVDDDAPLTKAQMQEVRKRAAEHEQDPGSAIPWEQVRTDVGALLK